VSPFFCPFPAFLFVPRFFLIPFPSLSFVRPVVSHHHSLHSWVCTPLKHLTNLHLLPSDGTDASIELPSIHRYRNYMLHPLFVLPLQYGFHVQKKSTHTHTHTREYCRLLWKSMHIRKRQTPPLVREDVTKGL
jgi:hypothetical protein